MGNSFYMNQKATVGPNLAAATPSWYKPKQNPQAPTATPPKLDEPTTNMQPARPTPLVAPQQDPRTRRTTPATTTPPRQPPQGQPSTVGPVQQPPATVPQAQPQYPNVRGYQLPPVKPPDVGNPLGGSGSPIGSAYSQAAQAMANRGATTGYTAPAEALSTAARYMPAANVQTQATDAMSQAARVMAGGAEPTNVVPFRRTPEAMPQAVAGVDQGAMQTAADLLSPQVGTPRMQTTEGEPPPPPPPAPDGSGGGNPDDFAPPGNSDKFKTGTTYWQDADGNIHSMTSYSDGSTSGEAPPPGIGTNYIPAEVYPSRNIAPPDYTGYNMNPFTEDIDPSIHQAFPGQIETSNAIREGLNNTNEAAWAALEKQQRDQILATGQTEAGRLTGDLAARGLGQSGDMLSGLAEVSGATQGALAEASAKIATDKMAQQMERLKTAMQYAEATGDTELKAQIAQQQAELDLASTQMQEQGQQQQLRQNVLDEAQAAMDNINTLLMNHGMSQDEAEARRKALYEIYAAAASGMPADQLQNMLYAILAPMGYKTATPGQDYTQEA